jgi:hypothetical protein
MGTGNAWRELPARVEEVRRRLERWRGTSQSRSRIPEPLWVAAVKVAGRYGIHRTAKALRLDYYSLKRRVEREVAKKQAATEVGTAAQRRGARKSGVRISRAPAASAAATFLELPAPAWAASGECVLELERPGGAKMRVHLKGVPARDVVAIGRGLWQGER